MKFTIKRLLFFVFLVALFLGMFGRPEYRVSDMVPLFSVSNTSGFDFSAKRIIGEGLLFEYGFWKDDRFEDFNFQVANSGDEDWLYFGGGVDFSTIRILPLIGIAFCFALVIVGFWITRTKPTIKRMMFFVFVIALILVTFGVPRYFNGEPLTSGLSGEGWLFGYAIGSAEDPASNRQLFFFLSNSGDENWLDFAVGVSYTAIQISQLIGIVVCIILVIVGFWITRTKPKSQASDKISRN